MSRILGKTGRRNLGRALGWAVRKANSGHQRFFDPLRTVVSLEPEGPVRGRVLLAHKVEGWIADPDDPALRRHNHFIEARILPKIFLERGFAVDFIDYLNRAFVPKRRYDLFLGARTFFEEMAGRLGPDCIKVVHLDTAHWLFNNTAALQRLQEVQTRRGVALPSYQPIEINRAIEVADCATMLGNQFTHGTYAFAGKPIFQIPNPSTLPQPWLPDKDFAACRTNFLWLGSFGFVHKGLDLALEAFARMPEMTLTICGPVESDRHFAEAFRRELRELPNIHLHGWIDVADPDFAALAVRSLATVYPSCAEGCSGAVVNCMRAGLIPIATRTAGLDLDASFGVEVAQPSVEAVEAAVRRTATLPARTLAAMARASWEEARDVYSTERYAAAMGAVIDQLLEEHPRGMAAGLVPFEGARPPAPTERLPRSRRRRA